jgi:hypothetical protein
MDESEEPVLELLEQYTLTPHPRLREKLTDLVTSRNLTPRSEPTILGVSNDAWTLDGKPGYVVLDATSSAQRVSEDMWFTCWADQSQLPIRMTISNGVDEDFVHTFLEPVQLRVPLTVPPGESRIFSVKTDKTWRAPSVSDQRNLGIRITTSI